MQHRQKTEQKPGDAGYPRTLLGLLRMYWSDLIKLNLLFVLCSLPVITLPAAVTAMNRVVMAMLYRKPFRFSWKEDFFGTLKKEFGRSLCIGVPAALLLALCVYAVLSTGWGAGGARMGLSAVAILTFFSCLNLLIYLFAMLAYLDLTIGQMCKNAFLLLFAEFGRNLLCDTGIAAFVLIMVLTFPFLAPLILFGYFSYPCFLIGYCIRPGLNRCALRPLDETLSDETEEVN